MTATEQQDFELVISTRHMLVASFVVVMLLGIFAGLSYVAGRAMDADSKPQIASTPSGTVAAEQQTTATVTPVAAVESVPAPSPERVDIGLIRPSYFQTPAAGEVFLQVAAVDRGPAEVFAEFLSRKGFAARFANGPDERSYRVLVGPFRDNGVISSVKSRLEDEGFRPFVQKF